NPKLDMNKQKISPAEVAKHNKPDDCWVVINGYVYDLTRFLPNHPGGQDVIKFNAGKDVTAIFEPLHAPNVIDKYIAPEKKLGPLEGSMPPELVCPPYAPGETK
nr:cytochrome b2 1-103 [Saccharomycetales]